MAGRGNSGSSDSLFRSTFGATLDDSAINDPLVRLSLSNGQVPDNVEQAHEPAGEQAVVENHRGAEAGSANGRQFRIDLNVCPEDVERAELATAGVEVRLPEQQATTSINGTPFIDLTVSDSDEDMPPAARKDEAQRNVGCESREATEAEVQLNSREIVLHESHEAINFWLPNLNEAYSEDAAAMDIDSSYGDETVREEAAGSFESESDDDIYVRAIEEYERKRKGKSIASGEHVGCSKDPDSIPLVDGVEEGNVAPDVITGHELVAYEGRDTRSESEAPTAGRASC